MSGPSALDDAAGSHGARAWQPPRGPLLLASAILLAGAATLAPLWLILHSQWTGIATYSHGYLLAAMAVWLAWRGWRRDPPAALGPSWWYLLALAATVALVVLLELLFLNVPRVFLLPPLIVAAVGAVFGHAAAMRLAAPAALMYCALPVWAVLNSALQSLTAAIVSTALAWTGVPALIQGSLISLPAGTFEIAEQCSGLRYLVISVTIAVFYGLAFLPTLRRRALLLGAAVAFTLLANWVRVYAVIVAGHLTDMQHYLVAREHVTFGWFVFALFFVPVALVARRLEGPALEERAVRFRSSLPTRYLPITAAAAIVAVALALTNMPAGARASATLAVREAPDAGSAEGWQPVFANAVEEHYAAPSSDVEVYRASYRRQDLDHRLIRFGNGFVPPTWQSIDRKVVTVSFDGAPLEVNELEGYLNGSRRLVLGWHWVAGRPATSPIGTKLAELRGLLAGRSDAAAVAVSALCELDCDAARALLTSYIRDPANTSRLSMVSTDERQN